MSMVLAGAGLAWVAPFEGVKSLDGGENFGWGIVATGKIAMTVGKVMLTTPGMAVAAVASRSLPRAQAFASEIGAERAYDDVAELVKDPAVDAIYVASPHARHADAVEIALRAGVPVLCEKPMTDTLAETERLVEVARETGTFLMEAVWSRFNPLAVALKNLVQAGELGEIRVAHAAFGFVAPYDPTGRLWDPALGGGALLDLGVYTVDFARALMGDPVRIQGTTTTSATGVDDESGLLLSFAGGATAGLSMSLRTWLPGVASVSGSLGTAELGPRFHSPGELVITRSDGSTEHHTIDDSGVGYALELTEVASCVSRGETQSAVMPLAESIATMRVLDAARQSFGR